MSAKSIFISLLIPILLGSSIFCFVQLTHLLIAANDDNPRSFDLFYSLIGALLISFPFLLFFVKAMLLQNTPRTSQLLTHYIIYNFLGLTLILVSEFSFDQHSMTIAKNSFRDLNFFYSSAVGIMNSILFMLYIMWYSKLSRGSNNNLSIGNPLPNFTLYQQQTKYTSKALTEQPCVFIFYRGNWCPFCIAQIKELSKAYDEAVHQGIQFVLVSPQPDQQSESLAKKLKMPFLFLRDKNNQVAKRLGIFHKNGLPLGLQALGYDSDTVMPTVIVTNKEGVVEYLDQTDNYRVRPEVNEFINLINPSLKL